jgi:hypothetical protein
MQDVMLTSDHQISKNKLAFILIPILAFASIVSAMILYNVGINIGSIIHYLVTNTSC